MKSFILCLAMATAALSTAPAFAGGGAAGDKADGDHSEFNLMSVLSHHLMDGDAIIFIDWNIGGEKKTAATKQDVPKHTPYYKNADGTFHYYEGGINMSITRRVLIMFVVAGLLILLLTYVARRMAANPYRIHGRFSNAIEALVVFIRDDIVQPNMGKGGKNYLHYMLTLFFFILTCNLIGLLPNPGESIQFFIDLGKGEVTDHYDSWFVKYFPIITPTGDIGVTGALAVLTYILIWYGGFSHQGIAYIKNVVPKGVPAPLWLIMWPIEFFISPLARSFSLMVRLYANMTAGHVIIIALIGMIFTFQNYFVGLGAVPGSLAIYMLEIFVSFLQAYIFTLLTAMFVGGAFHRH